MLWEAVIHGAAEPFPSGRDFIKAPRSAAAAAVRGAGRRAVTPTRFLD